MRCILVFRMSKAMQASAFEAWRSHSSRRLHNRRAVSQALGMLRNRALAEAFAAWRASRERRIRNLAVLGAAAARLQIARLSSAWHAWHLHAAMHAAQTRFLTERLARLRSRMLVTALTAWHGAAKVQAAHAAILRKCLARLHSCTLAAAWTAWQQRAAVHAAQTRILRQCVARMHKCTLAAAWAAWHHAAVAWPATRVELRRLAARLQVRALGMAWMTWREHAAQAISSHRMLGAAVAKLTWQSMAQALASWRDWMQSKQRATAIMQVSCLLRSSTSLIGICILSEYQGQENRATCPASTRNTTWVVSGFGRTKIWVRRCLLCIRFFTMCSQAPPKVQTSSGSLTQAMRPVMILHAGCPHPIAEQAPVSSMGGLARHCTTQSCAQCQAGEPDSQADASPAAVCLECLEGIRRHQKPPPRGHAAGHQKPAT